MYGCIFEGLMNGFKIDCTASLSKYDIFLQKNQSMKTTTYTKFKQNLKKNLDKVFKDDRPLFVTRGNGKDVVILSKSDYEGMQETFYLMKSPRNAERLLQGLEKY
jgi:antitoxin YefM